MKNEEAEVAELFGAVEVAMKPGLKKVEAFATEYNEYVHSCQETILAQLKEPTRVTSVCRASTRFAHLPDAYEEIAIIRSVLTAWVNPRSKGPTPLCVLEKREGYVVATTYAGNCTSEMGRKPVCTELSRYARSKEDWPVGTAIMPKWLRLAVGKLKLIPVGAYLGECGLHAGNGLFFVCPRIKKTARKKGARK